jgi:hypothetical protein
LECLSDASFLDKLLVLPANVRLDWKVIARYKNSSLFGFIINKEGKKFYNVDTRKEASGGDSKKQLPDDHPVIKMERSTWEVRSALSIVLNSVENLNAHKALVRRVQVITL